MGSHLSAFVAKELREPNAQELADILQCDLEDRRQREAERHEREIQRAYMSTPGADEAGWQRDRAGVLAEARKADTLRQREEARQSQRALYRNF